MQKTFEPRAPRLRCRECGEDQGINSVCHHCGDPLCGKHDTKVQVVDGPVLSREYAGLGLDSVSVHHCRDHQHVVKGRLRNLLYGAAAVAVLGLVLTVTGLAPVGILLLLAGLGGGTAAYFGDQARLRAIHDTRPPLPVVPAVESAEIVERLVGRLTLDDEGRYHSEASPVTGSVDLKLTFGRQDRERLEQYQAEYGLGPDDDVEFCAGFVMLHGRSGLVFDDGSRGTVRRLSGSIAGQPFFGASQARASARWEQSFGYRLDDASKPDHLPLWLTPSLMPEQDKRTIEFEVQWIAFQTANKADLAIETLELLRLEVPEDWGHVESVSWSSAEGTVRHGAVSDGTDSAGQPCRIISWTHCALTERERREQRFSVSVRFEEKIDPAHVLRGRIQAGFTGTLSGLTGVGVAHPLGGRRSDAAPGRARPGSAVRTEVDAQFELSLRQIRYQAVRKVPDRKVDADAERSERTEFRGVIPDYQTVIELTNAISDRCYIKRVLENPPRSSGTGNAVNRYWNIAGRRYDGVFPVDFQIILTGEENNPGGMRSEGGDTIVGLTVTGSYANDSMFGQIGKHWNELQEWVSDALEQAKIAAPTRFGPGFADSEPDAFSAAAPFNGNGNGNAAPDLDGVPPASNGADPRLMARKLAELREALLAGRISEVMYERLRAETEQEGDHA